MAAPILDAARSAPRAAATATATALVLALSAPVGVPALATRCDRTRCDGVQADGARADAEEADGTRVGDSTRAEAAPGQQSLPEIELEGLRNPVWTSADNLRDPSVLKTDSGHLLFFSRFSGAGKGWTDPDNWEVDVVFTRDFVRFDGQRAVSPKGHASPGDVVRWHGRWILPYQSYPGSPTRLVFSESADLRSWSQPKPFLAEALTLPWNALRRVIDPTLVVDGDTLHCYFVGSANHTDAAGKTIRANLMGHAVTNDPDLRQWRILTQDAPLIGHSDRAPDGVENTMVFRTGDRWTMIYSEGLTDQHLALATSTDLITWRLEEAIALPRQAWMASKHGAPFVWRDGARWTMILMGEDASGRTTFGLLTSPDGRRWTPLPSER